MYEIWEVVFYDWLPRWKAKVRVKVKVESFVEIKIEDYIECNGSLSLWSNGNDENNEKEVIGVSENIENNDE